ncbi:hypothetical protein VNO77_26988 [Canavalia gladiata]|uniref:Uncharacterized protein n=1 Tax=Canavalia gladiata TaxID=3824 RepID=A0AAN9Q626_CANGL
MGLNQWVLLSQSPRVHRPTHSHSTAPTPSYTKTWEKSWSNDIQRETSPCLYAVLSPALKSPIESMVAVVVVHNGVGRRCSSSPKGVQAHRPRIGPYLGQGRKRTPASTTSTGKRRQRPHARRDESMGYPTIGSRQGQ